MYPITPELAQAFETARVMLEHELARSDRPEPQRGRRLLWAGVDHEGRIVLGTPLLHPGEGFYVDHTGHWTEA